MISSGGGGGGAPRVSIPNSARKTIQNIKEIAGNHSDEEVYAMLRECNMDPNETAQKLLLQDTFHEVKRKRDRRKENVSNKESADASWRSGIQGRGSRGGRGSYSSRYLSHDIIGAKNFASAKESAANQGPDKGAKTSATQNVENKPPPFTSSSVSLIVNGPSKQAHVVPPHGATSQMPVSSGSTSSEEKVTAETSKIRNTASPEINIKSGQTTVPGGALEQSVPSTEQSSPSLTTVPAMGVCASVSESVLEPSRDSCTTDALSAIERQVGNQTTAVEPTNESGISVVTDSSSSLSEKKAPEATSSYTHGKLPSKSQVYEINHISEESQARPTSSGTGTSGSRPPSNYSNRSQQLVGPQKAGPVKEWKPKQTNPNLAQTSGAVGNLGVATTAAGAAANTQASEETTSKLQKKLEELQFDDGQHVIFPSHIQVPESERTVLNFGSFTASFGLPSTFANGPDDEKSSTPLSESSREIEENVEEPSSSVENVSPAAQEDDYSTHHQSSVDIPENLSPGEAGISNISAAQEYHQSQQETSLAPEGPQFSVVQTAPVYSTFGLIPPMIGNPFAGLGNSESQARDASRVSGFVVQQPFDPSASYYTQVYRPGADNDGRYSPFLASGPATKYPGSLSSQTDQSQQESGNSLVQPAPGSATVTQAVGVMQNSIAVTQPPVPVFRHPAGVHISHYPPNYIPYSPYFSPFYVQPGSVHPFISNAAFPQQHPAGTIYPPVAAAAAHVKYPISQFKTGTNNALSNHAGMAAGYGPYSSSQTGYCPSPAASTVNSTTNEDLTGPQYKESSVYLAGQQSEGSAVWIPAPPRDVPNLQAGSFYGLPQGQHVTFTPTQGGHGTFPGIFHPTQMGSTTVHPLLQQSQSVAGAVEMVGPQGGVYPPPQRAPINWANNY